jgi:hypothetical protein
LIVLVRHAPVTALLILLAVCLTCLCGVLGDFAALASVLPLASVVALFLWRARAA